MQKRTLILSLLAVFLALLLGFSAFSTEQTLDNTIPREAEGAVQFKINNINVGNAGNDSILVTKPDFLLNGASTHLLLKPIDGKSGLYELIDRRVCWTGETNSFTNPVFEQGMFVLSMHFTWDHPSREPVAIAESLPMGTIFALHGVNLENGEFTSTNPILYVCDNTVPEEAEGVTQLTFDKINAPNSGGDTVIITDGYENVTNSYAYVIRLKEIDGKHGLFQVDKVCEYWDRNTVFGTTLPELSEHEVLIAIHTNPDQQNVTTQFTSETVLSLWGINPQTGTLTASTPMIYVCDPTKRPAQASGAGILELGKINYAHTGNDTVIITNPDTATYNSWAQVLLLKPIEG
ncbi:MAG: hypothetical protein IJW77_12245 [Clostridia bacterium]|nr:hypothetical protein [Clostridia bacterium]